MTITNLSNGDYVLTANPVLPDGKNRFVLFMWAAVASGPSSASMAGLNMVLYAETAIGDERAQIWGLAIPDSVSAGTYTITKTGGTIRRFHYAVFTGVSNTDPVVDNDAVRINVATSDSTSLTVDCVKDGWVHDIVFANPAKNAGAGQTVLYNVTGRPGISYKNNLTTGTTTTSWSWVDSRSSYAVVSLRPAPEQTIRPIIMF